MIAVSFSMLLKFLCPLRVMRELILYAILIVYIAIVRYPHSLLRAISLYTSFRIFRYFGIRSSLEDALVAGSLLLISIQPDILFSKGYQLSFLAVSAIALVAVPFTKTIRISMPWIKKRKCAELLISAVTVTVSIQVFTLPVILEYFGRVPLISPAANLLFILPVTVSLHLGLLQVILPSIITGYTVAPVLRHLSLLLSKMPAFLLKSPQPAILKGDIENMSYCAGLLFLIIALGNKCAKRKVIFIFSVLCFLSSFTTGALNGKVNQRLLNSDPGRSRFLDTNGITQYIGENKIVIMEKTVSFSRMERYIRTLWGAGISEIDILIITPGILNSRRGISLLIKRMGTKRVYCSPYIKQHISEMIDNEISWKVEVEAVDSIVTLKESFGTIKIIPPAYRLKPGVRIDAAVSGIKYKIE
ncbi:MAG: hypothetical protein E4H16_03800 [Candidatus Atribacteria bacterium]|nr:MAG: hypothetical protein E4H16_03800 [Candidatus Atribacteria bacterium]